MQPEGTASPVSISSPTLFLFPPKHRHGWTGSGDSERVVLHFSNTPTECANLLPARGYFRISLTDSDCDRLRELGKRAERIIREMNNTTAIEEQALLYELSILALKEVSARSISMEEKAKKKVDQALARYSAVLPDTLTIQELSKSLYTSPAQLRRYFHKILGESPRSAFSRIRLQKAEEFLGNTDHTVESIAHQVGFATSSALINAMKRVLGLSPTELRTRRRSAPSIAKNVNSQND